MSRNAFDGLVRELNEREDLQAIARAERAQDAKRGRGRPVQGEALTERLSARVTTAQKEKFESLGAGEWLRVQLGGTE